MSRRRSQPDTDADIQLREIISAPARQSFVVVAGAGSGKTTSLVKALDAAVRAHGAAFKKNRQRVACITYTEIAAKEIWDDVGNSHLVHVSTIHSFLWTIVQTFQKDIRGWVTKKIEARLEKLREEAAGFGQRTQQRTRQKNEETISRYESYRSRIASVSSFRYGTGSDYANGVLGHDDIIRMTTEFLCERPLLRLVVGQQFPFVFVDESQDTMPPVVDALKAVERQLGPKFCLGFFGDPMQQIYTTGIGKIAAEENWREITKPQNFRCSAGVLAVANAIRRSADGLVQIPGKVVSGGDERAEKGTARFFVLPADARRDERIANVRAWMANENHDPEWGDGSKEVKTLVIVHRMAAGRLRFPDLYSAFNDHGAESLKAAFLEATAWPLRPFFQAIVPLSRAVLNREEFQAMAVLRTHSPRLTKEAIKGKNLASVLRELRASSEGLAKLMQPEAQASCGAVLRFARDSEILVLDPRVQAYLDGAGAQAPEAQPDEDEKAEAALMRAYLDCPVAQVWGYQEYVTEQSPFSTQQGIKGTEFPRVLVVLDDEEGVHPQFSYDKYFGIVPLSARDEQNIREGRETVVDRTRRLFYVCCTRALTDLAVVLFARDVAQAERRVRDSAIFAGGDVYRFD